MKLKMSQALLLFFLTLNLGLTGCSKDQDDESSLLGEWVEESPVADRTELFFHSANRLSRTSNGVTEDYFYSIVGNSIVLRLRNGSGESSLFFRQMSENTFQIENLYPSIPEEETTYMIFRRKTGSDQ